MIKQTTYPNGSKIWKINGIIYSESNYTESNYNKILKLYHQNHEQ